MELKTERILSAAGYVLIGIVGAIGIGMIIDHRAELRPELTPEHYDSLRYERARLIMEAEQRDSLRRQQRDSIAAGRRSKKSRPSPRPKPADAPMSALDRPVELDNGQ